MDRGTNNTAKQATGFLVFNEHAYIPDLVEARRETFAPTVDCWHREALVYTELGARLTYQTYVPVQYQDDNSKSQALFPLGCCVQDTLNML